MAEPLLVWSYSRCSTCRKALAWLEQQGIVHQVVDITESPPDRSMLAAAADHFGRRAPLFNTSGQSYRALGSAVVKAMSDPEALDALAADGKLIKRPFVALPDGRFLVGFKQDQWIEAFGR
ncbi:arsenate reductase family protein [Synechococcus sp. UW105]|uniref:arsenate reductase family protein n=1 Tax=unclassified Synechococcus TaxID=2626047 RepID=UPI000C8CD949|nr:arsenate reductase family protein [Synechococcus sp. UW105]MAS28588.1 ArsC family transcriptional regulator [Synechococcus sp. NAT40]RZO14884.1 MAG: arsenate reductase family protein [Synechococcus sp. MED-G135]